MSNENPLEDYHPSLFMLSPELFRKLVMELDYSGDFAVLGISEQEALQLDTPSLQRLIHEKTGTKAAYEQERERQVQEANKKFFEEMKTINRILF